MPAEAAYCRIARPIGCSDRRSIEAARATIAARGQRVERHHADDFRRPPGQRAGLVERDAPHAAGLLQVRPALDQHALFRRAGQRGHDRHRRGDHQRARAGDDEQHQRAVDPGLPGGAAQHRRQRGDQNREPDHRRRVDAREPIDEGLCGRALRLCLLDQVDDFCQGRVAAHPRHPHLQRAAAVDGAGEHLVARRLVHGQRLAGHRRLIDGALPGDDLAVERDLLARHDHNQRARGNLLDVDPALARLVAQQRVGRRQIEQRPDGVPCALERARFQHLRDGEQHDHRGSLGPLVEDHRARGGDHHQHVDVERPCTHGAPGTAHRHRAACRHRQRVGGAREPRRQAECLQRQAGAERAGRDATRAPAAASRRCPPTTRGSSCSSQARMPASATAPAMAAADSLAASYFTSSRCPMTSAVNASTPAQMFEAPLDQDDLVTAVHPLDLEGRLGVELADRAGAGHRLSLPPGRDAGLARGRHLHSRERSPEGCAVRRWLSSTCSSPCSNRRTMW